VITQNNTEICIKASAQRSFSMSTALNTEQLAISKLPVGVRMNDIQKYILCKAEKFEVDIDLSIQVLKKNLPNDTTTGIAVHLKSVLT